MKDIYAVLDIGSATLKFLVAEVNNINVNVLFVKTIPSHGVKKGIIEDDRILIRDIRKLIDEAEAFLESKITSVALTIPTIKAKLYQSDSSISLSDAGSKVSTDDIVRVLRLSSKFKRSKDEEVVSIIPVRYHSDKGATVEAPLGELSRNLIVDSLVITTSKELLYPYISVVEKCGVEVLDITINAFACAKEAFDAVYLQEGALLIDMGYKTSTVSFYKDGYLQYLTVCQVGGYDFTRKIAQNMQISMNQAEAYKIKYGSLDVTQGQNDIIHTTFVDEQKRDYTQQDLADLLNETAYEVMNKILHDSDMALLINELRGSGAEAISVNNHRVTPNTAVVCNSAFLGFDDGDREAAPFKIYVIGNAELMEESLNSEGSHLRVLKILVNMKL